MTLAAAQNQASSPLDGRPPLQPLSSRTTAQHSFLAVLGRAKATPGQTPEQQARDAAQQFVAQSLVQPMLKQMRDMEQTSPLFAPGPGEKQFRALMDAQVAQNITTASHFPLVDRVARQLLKKSSHGERTPVIPPKPPGATLSRLSIGTLPSAR